MRNYVKLLDFENRTRITVGCCTGREGETKKKGESKWKVRKTVGFESAGSSNSCRKSPVRVKHSSMIPKRGTTSDSSPADQVETTTCLALHLVEARASQLHG